MQICSAEQMRDFDRRAIENFNISGIVLMENAAQKVAFEAFKMIKEIENPKVFIFAGKGNNGGDGFAAARILKNMGVNVFVFLTGNEADLKGDAKINFNIIKKMKINIESASDLNFKNEILCDLIIDAIFGTGLKREITGDLCDLIENINNCGKEILSIDIPSGIDSDTGNVMGKAICADITVTFVCPKLGLILYPGAEYAGKVMTKDISVPKEILEEMEIKSNVLDIKAAKELIPKRKKRSNKGTFGKIMVVAGSKNMTGACFLACKGAYNSGAGIVYSCIAESGIDITRTLIPEAVQVPLTEKDGMVCLESYFDIEKMLHKATAAIIGPGLGISSDVSKFMEKILCSINVPIVIDADALNAAAKNINILKEIKAPFIITPHLGEMSRLTGKSVDCISKNMIETAVKFSEEFGCVTVLKDSRTIISSPDGKYFINTTGNSSMAKGGSGDVLSGIIGGLLAQGSEVFDAAVLGTFLHGLAGEFASKKLSMYSVLAGNIADNIFEAVNYILK